ncbi:hypothetical protein A1356_10720 [Methylomonas koyamae]|uniref:Di-haem cytochrome c peroxidase domain-containing protein n=1 Tax=Methylomonas koyamae TaxID=702114 RepID=A0AA91DDG5_9GAMM|nr:hypothetical protein A1356_10720 [Methylomonas koyamae]
MTLSAAVLCTALADLAAAPLPVSLRNVPVPPVPGLLDGAEPIVVDKNAAIALGKALFWDQNLGSDGQACASCHFSAGADVRSKNQINPGQNAAQASGQTFDTLPSGSGGPNHELSLTDFPLLRFANPLSNSSPITFSTDDTVGSAGTFGGEFAGVSQSGASNDRCVRAADEVFNVSHVGTRKVTPRNAPTVINAVFNHRNFWDGRANNSFNGSSPWGPRDPDAGVWIKLSAKAVVKQRLNLINSSLASQAVAPPVFNDVEMGCNGRRWPDIGRKLLSRQPLQYQPVHPQDSVLGSLSLSSGNDLKPGLKTTYRNLITRAFNPQYWSYAGIGPFGALAKGGMAYNQMEANFAMFFGLAIQLYESTLVSDQAPFDTSPLDANMVPTWSNVAGATPAETAAKITSLKRGFNLFVNNHCSRCHVGPTLSQAAVAANAALLTPTPGAQFGPPATPIAFGPDAFGPYAAASEAGVGANPGPVTRDFNILIKPRLMDLGFSNIGVTRPDADPGLAGDDAFGNPLAYAAQYVSYLIADSAGVIDLPVEKVRACDFITGLALNVTLATDNYFLPGDGLQADGSREGVPRDRNCADPIAAYIPTPAAAQANLNGPKMALATQGAFKVPTLRNVELTGPYMHNGGLATLAQVIEFYARHGNVVSDFQNFNMGGISSALSNVQNTTDLTHFLQALTDERVRYQKAPFDHPQLTLANGHPGNALQVDAGNPLGTGLAKDRTLVLPAVGAGGGAPILPFLAPAP